MKHLKLYKIFESSNDLFHEISDIEFSLLVREQGINVENDVINYLKNYVDKSSKYSTIISIENDIYTNVGNKKIYRLYIQTVDKHNIYVYQLLDEYFVISMRFKYYKCDELKGVIQFLESYSI